MQLNHITAKIKLASVLLMLSSFAAKSAGITTRPNDTIFNAQSVLKIMTRVGDWQLQSWKTDGFKHKKTDWTNAAIHRPVRSEQG
jgi:unsaturated rhamnogalacturonyl hydrolase